MVPPPEILGTTKGMTMKFFPVGIHKEAQNLFFTYLVLSVNDIQKSRFLEMQLQGMLTSRYFEGLLVY